MPVYPEDEYLAAIGRLAYAVAGLEWLVLGDLSQHEDLPAGMDVETLAGLTTGQIADRLSHCSPSDDAVREWLQTGGERLREAAAIRNHLLHARPATVEGAQRLHRWRVTPAGSDAFTISVEWIEAQLERVEEMSREVDALRIAAR